MSLIGFEKARADEDVNRSLFEMIEKESGHHEGVVIQFTSEGLASVVLEN